MEELYLYMKLGNAVFEGDELARGIAYSLHKLASHIEEQTRVILAGNGSRMPIWDSNGNVVGQCHFKVRAHPLIEE